MESEKIIITFFHYGCGIDYHPVSLHTFSMNAGYFPRIYKKIVVGRSVALSERHGSLF